jgi:hypothetical protein
MRRFMSLVLLLAVVGIAVADVPVGRRTPSPPFYVGVLDSGLPGGQVVAMLLQMAVPSYWPVAASATVTPRYAVPPAPVCDLVCPLRPQQDINE